MMRFFFRFPHSVQTVDALLAIYLKFISMDTKSKKKKKCHRLSAISSLVPISICWIVLRKYWKFLYAYTAWLSERVVSKSVYHKVDENRMILYCI